MQPNPKAIVVLFVGIISLQGCLSTARLSDFPKSSKGYDFNKIAASQKTDKDKGWNSKTGFEFYLKTNTADSSAIRQAITDALTGEGFQIKFIDENNGTILSERGLRGNEWNSVAGVYYVKAGDGYEMYINCKITQDITGGIRDDRVMRIGSKICELLKNCQQSYPVTTNAK